MVFLGVPNRKDKNKLPQKSVIDQKKRKRSMDKKWKRCELRGAMLAFWHATTALVL